MSDLIKFAGSALIALILVLIPGLFVTSIAFEWHGFLKALLCVATVCEYVLTMYIIYERGEE